MHNLQGYARTQDAAKYVGLSKSLLEKLRITGKGPRFYKLPGGAAVLYRMEDLDAWVMSGASTSTSEH